jgi:hypothetical protein
VPLSTTFDKWLGGPSGGSSGLSGGSGGLSGGSTRLPSVADFSIGASGGSAPITSSKERMPPERIDVNSIFNKAIGGDATGAGLQLASVAGRAPGYIYERPIAIFDTVAQKAGLGSPVSGIEQGLGGIPILGPLLGLAGDALTGVSNVVAAPFNAQAIQLLRAIPASTPDSAPMPDTDFFAGLNRLLGNQKTVGEFRAEMAKRGLTPGETAGKSAFDFGNRMVSDNPLADAGIRMAVDPLNAVLGLGLIGKAVRGVGLLAKAVTVGAELKTPLRLAEAIDAVAVGSAREATWAGVTGYLGQVSAGTSRALSGYRKVAVASTIGQAAIDTFTPETGPFALLHEVNKAAMDNRPLSDNMAFAIWSGYNFPIRAPFAAIKAKVGAAAYAKTGSEVFPMLEDKLTSGKGLKTRAQKQAYLAEKMGPDGLLQYAYLITGSLANKSVSKRIKDGLRSFDSFDQSVLAMATLDTVVKDKLTQAFRKNTLRGRDVVAAAEEWHAFRTGGNDNVINRVAIRWNGDDAIETFVGYRAAVSRLREVSDGRLSALAVAGDPFPTIGLTGVMSTHDLSAMQDLARNAAVDGYVPIETLNTMISRAPQLVALDNTGFWEKHLLPGATSVQLDRVVGKLAALKKDAPTLRELTHEMAAAERPASYGLPDGQPVPDVPPVNPDATSFDALRPRQPDPRVSLADQVGIGDAVVAEPGYLYHTTNTASQIAADALRPQRSLADWPWTAPGDYASSKRSYWSRDPATLDPNGAVLRIKEADHRVIHEPEGGAQYLKTLVKPQDIEILGGDGQWYPLKDFYEPAGGSIPPDIRPIANLVKDIPSATPVAQAIRADMDARTASRMPGATPEQVVAETIDLARQDAAVEAAIPLTKFEHGGINAASDPFKDGLSPVERFLHEQGPQYTIKPMPQDGWLFDPRAAGPVMSALRDQTALGEWMFRSGPFSPVTRFLGWATSPVHSGALTDAARQARYAELVPKGATPEQIDAWIVALTKKGEDLTVGPFKVQIFRGPGGLPANTINALANTIFSEKTLAAVGPNFEKVLDRASNRFIRQIETKNLLGTAGRLEQAADSVYRGWQVAPFVGPAGRQMSKTWYTIIRFVADPRWHAMNILEADIIGGLHSGPSATRFTGALDVGASPAAAAHAVRGGLDAADSGWLYSRHHEGYVSRAFDVDRPDTMLTTLRGMDDAGQASIRKMFPEAKTNEDIVVELDKMLYDYDTKGVKQTITDNLQHFGDAAALREPGAAAMVQRIWDANQTLYDDILRMFQGNASRSTLERVMNSYWLYWPISYQLKAGKWMFDTLTHRAFGKQTNLAGAAVYDQLVQMHQERVQNDPSYAAIFSENPISWQIAQMMLPITPGDLGVSLSRAVRYPIGWVRDATGGDQGPLGFWGKYKASKDPSTMAAGILNLGLPYTLSLATKSFSELFPSEPAGSPSPQPLSLN